MLKLFILTNSSAGRSWLSRLNLLIATLLASPALAGNYFAGIRASDSKGSTSSGIMMSFKFIWMYLDSFDSPSETNTRQRRQKERFRGPPKYWFRLQCTRPSIVCRCLCRYKSTCRHIRFCRYEIAYLTPIGSYYPAY